MKILIIANIDKGLFKFRKELITSLMEKNEVVLAFEFGDITDSLKELGCKCINIPIDRRGINPIKDFKLFFTYKKLINQETPDLVITYTIKPNIYAGLLCRVKKIPYAVNITGLGTAFQNKGLLRCLVKTLYKMSLKSSSVVFFENAANRDVFINEKIIKTEQAYLLNGAGVNLEQYTYMDYPKEQTETRFLFIGRVMKEKGIDELFASMKHLVADGINCSLDVLGGYEEDYKNTIERYEREGWLHYYGYQKDVRPFIKESHCFVLPSWHEGMANTNLECAASGRPLITSAINGCMEAVVNNISGYCVDVKNSESLYQAMKKFTGLTYRERMEMGLAGRKHMEETFDKNLVVKNTISKLEVRE